MQIIGRSSSVLKNAISSGLDSVASGIAQSTKTDGVAALDHAISTFTKTETSPQTILDPQSKVSGAADFPDPESFLKNQGNTADVLSAISDPRLHPPAELSTLSGNLSGILKPEGVPIVPQNIGGVSQPQGLPISSSDQQSVNLPQQLQTLQNMQSTVDRMNDLQQSADRQFQAAQTSSPADVGTSFGSTLKDLSQSGLQKGVDELKKKGVWSGSDSKTDSSSDSVGEPLPDNLSKLGQWGKGKTIVEGEWHAARIGDVDYKDSGDWGSFSAKGATDFVKVQGRIFGDYNVDPKNLTIGGEIGAQGRLELVGSHYEVEYDSPAAYNLGGHDINSKTKVNADASVGATGFAEVDVSLGKDTHLGAGAGGFEGASASLSGSESVGDLGSVNGSVTGWGGFGAKADFDAGMKDGKVSFKFGAGLAIGLGLEYDYGFSVDFPKIGDAIYHAGSDAIDAVGDAGKWVGGASKDAANWIGTAAQTVGDAAQKAVEDVVNTASSAAKDAADAAAQAAKDAADAAAKAVKDAADAAAQAAKDAADAVADAAQDVADTLGDAAKGVGNAVSDALDW